MASNKSLVLLTGANGFLGAHVFDKLLSAGYRVRGALRTAAKASFFKEKYASQSADFSFVTVPDIQAEHALDSAMEGVDYVCHVASPFTYAVNDVTKDLLEPAMQGTHSVLSSALKTSTVKKFVLVSSFAAVNDREKGPRPGYAYSEKDWNPVTQEQAVLDSSWGYPASKTFAERAAWDIWRSASPKPGFDLVALNPPMIYGPPLHEIDATKGLDGLNTSLKNLATGLQGTDPAFAPKVATPRLAAWVDVRDVAKAHVLALQLPQGSSERFLLCSGTDYFEDGLAGLRASGERGLGELGACVDRTQVFSLDSSKAEKMLGLKFIGFEQCVTDVWKSLKKLGMVGSEGKE